MNEITNSYVWRQRREDRLRETERDRLVRTLRAERKQRANRVFSLAWELRRLAGLLLKTFRRLESKKGART
jgi:hypothetical protein